MKRLDEYIQRQAYKEDEAHDVLAIIGVRKELRRGRDYPSKTTWLFAES